MKKEYKRILITAALPYANGKIHLGHLAGAYLPADIYARYQRLQKRDVLFICGSDEHGVPITITAENEKTTPQAIVDRYHELNKKAFGKFGMSFDNYSRTSLPLHHSIAQEFFIKMHRAGILKEKIEKQLYDQKARMFLPDRYVEGTCPTCKAPDARGDQCEKCGTFLNPTDLIDPKSKISGDTPIVRETSHWYFPLGDYQQRLKNYIDKKNTEDGWRDNVIKYCQSWFNDGLQDRAVTRDLQWGVEVPLEGYKDKVLYVWFDAVLGYISSTKEWSQKNGNEKWKDYWTKDDTKYVAFIGKDNVVFHCIVFPAMLMAWNDNSDIKYVLPTNVPANEFLNLEGQKFSKSRGWGVDVDEFLEKYPADSLRYALAVNMPESRDSDFYWKDFQAKHNNELADILGNFVNRTFTFVHKNFEGVVPQLHELSDLDNAFVNELTLKPETVGNLIEKYKFREAVLETMNLARSANKYFNDSEPWKTNKNNPEKCSTTINISLQAVRTLSILFQPVIPGVAHRIHSLFNLPVTSENFSWNNAAKLELKPGTKLGISEILFTKIEDEIIQKELDKLSVPNKSSDVQVVEIKPTITIEDFKKIDLRVATVMECEKVPKSEKLLKLQILLGAEKRQLVAGIAQHYKPSDLIGKKIIVVANLQPTKLMGTDSQGMLLAASDTDGKLVFVTTAGEISNGAIVK
ncbi:MAG: methionine--tRNA ligase [Bacteroidota bacterium]|nr:methionine--tRNA ligase [Bacteroidota bacterium]